MGSHPFICCGWWITPPFHFSLISGSISSIKVQNNSSKFSNFRIIRVVCESVVSKSISSNLVCCRVFDCDISQQVFPEGKISTKPKLVTNTLVHVVQYEYCYVVDLEWSVIKNFGWNYIIRHTTTGEFAFTSKFFTAIQQQPWHAVLLRWGKTEPNILQTTILTISVIQK